MLAAGLNDGGIYFNVLNNPANFSPAEVALVRGWYNDEMAEHGGVNGKSLDQHFFDATLLITDESLASRYSDSPAVYATGPIDPNTVVTGDNGLSSFDNAVIRLWVHDLFDNGAMDGSITKFTLLSPYALDAVDGTPGSLDPADVKALLAADLAAGAPDGTPLRLAFSDALDAVYFNEGGASISKLFSTVGIDQVEADALFADWAKRRGYSQSAALRLVLAEAAIE